MLLFKIILAPILIGLVSLAGRKWGHGIEGWLLGLPLNSGPILFFLVLQEGRPFAANAAAGSLLGIVAWAAFGIVYAVCCTRLPWWGSTLAGWAAYGAVAWLLLPVRLGVHLSIVVVLTGLTAILLAFPRPAREDAPPPKRKYELWLRMITATAMLLTLTDLAKAMGPLRSGFFASFPAFTTILAVFSHQRSASAAVRVLRGVTMGLYTAATFCFMLAICLVHLGAAVSFAVAIGAAGLVQMISLVFVRRGA